MIIVDASAMVDILTGEGRADELSAVAMSASRWVMPEHFILEVTSGVRGAWLAGRLDRPAFEAAVDRLMTFRMVTYPVGSLMRRITELAANANPYDAAYVALAEQLGAPLVTADNKLSRIPGARCRFLPEPASLCRATCSACSSARRTPIIGSASSGSRTWLAACWCPESRGDATQGSTSAGWPNTRVSTRLPSGNAAIIATTQTR